ncbi:DUF4153 domain-containing protein [Oceanirhabdus sp. W0125-5]|uniref:DUF4153 domain-containing protein n=1 Tax=Oceanirhabdus sp. W0125-5 TaxID=2999116 RepID=UPI0022F33A28|nr:DUF4153 domain-containing protein [Oceanirhabdus sp. W0125-5]WBW97174.1 DUF4153 domain-containing protein [Oceanirhabdus sp. W0125-5]
MKISELFKDILKGIRNSIRRFPETIGISTACVILLIYMHELGYGPGNQLRETLARVTMVLALGIPLSLCIKLYFERIKDYKKSIFYGTYVAGALLLIIYYHVFLNDFEMVSITRYIGISLILYLIFICIPYLPKRDNFELYVIRVFARFFTTILYSVVLYLGLAAILFTIDQLLGINIKGEIFYYTWLIVVGVFAPSFFLAGLPQNNEELFLKDYSKLIKVLVLYIIIPLISVYTIILYLYFGKIIITRQWPQGLVSHLVLWYSAISAAVIFLISPLLNKNPWIKKYIKVFPKAILPLIIMMFISIGIRINAYGITENRYFVVALGIWVFLVMIYFSFTKEMKNIVLPISLAVIIFVSLFGPLSSFSISKYSQNKRFEKILLRNNMIKNKKAVKASSDVSKNDLREISSILSYFNRSHSLDDVRSLPKGFKLKDMEKVLGVKYKEQYYYNDDEYFYFDVLDNTEAIDIRGYEYLFDLRNHIFQESKDIPLSVNYNDTLSRLSIKENGEEIYSIELTDFAEALIEKYGANQNNKGLSVKEMSIEDENDKIKVKIQFSYISGNKKSSTEKIESLRFGFNVFVKVK